MKSVYIPLSRPLEDFLSLSACVPQYFYTAVAAAS